MKVASIFLAMLLLPGNAAYAQDVGAEADEAASVEPAETPPNSDIGPAEGNIFDAVHQSYQNEVEAGRLDPDIEPQLQQGGSEGPATSEGGGEIGSDVDSAPEQEVITSDGEAVEIGPDVQPTPEQVEQMEHPFGDPANYENQPADEPLPEKVESSEDSSDGDDE